MGKLYMILVLFLSLWIGACCQNPGVFGKIDAAMHATQQYYDPLVDKLQNGQAGTLLKMAMISADSALLMLGALQEEYCPAEGEVDQALLQAGNAKLQAVLAGVNP